MFSTEIRFIKNHRNHIVASLYVHFFTKYGLKKIIFYINKSNLINYLI
jgi:hypothetical protein